MMVVVIYSFNRRHVCCQIHPYVLNIYPCLPRRAANTNMWVLGDHHVLVKKRRRIYYFGRFMSVPMMFDNCQCSYTFSVKHSNLMYFISLITLNVHKKNKRPMKAFTIMSYTRVPWVKHCVKCKSYPNMFVLHTLRAPMSMIHDKPRAFALYIHSLKYMNTKIANLKWSEFPTKYSTLSIIW